MSDTVIPAIDTKVPEVKEYRYQPTDEEGRPLGGVQVIKYTNVDELTQKLTEQNTLLVRKLREETKKNRLGIEVKDEINPEAPKLKSIMSLTPRQLTNDERYQLAQDLLDPEKALDAQSRIFEASVGARPEELGKTVDELQYAVRQMKAKEQAEIFVDANPDYFVCQQNFETMYAWMVRYGLDLVSENFQLAYDTLKSQDLLILKPESPRNTPVQVVPPTPPEVPTPTPIAPGLATGFTRENSSSVGFVPVAGDDIVYEINHGGRIVKLTGLAAINAMPGDEYGRRLRRDPEFARKVNKLEQEAARKNAPPSI